MPEQRADFKVAAGQHDAHAPAGEALPLGQHRGQRYRAGRLDHLLEVAPGQRHGLDDLRLGYGDHRYPVGREHREVARADQRPQPVGNGLRIVVGNPLAVGQ